MTFIEKIRHPSLENYEQVKTQDYNGNTGNLI